MDFRFTRDNPSLFFRNADSGSMIILTWKDGLVFKSYEGRLAGRKWPLPEQPATADAFEDWARQAFQLGCLWYVRQATGFETQAA